MRLLRDFLIYLACFLPIYGALALADALSPTDVGMPPFAVGLVCGYLAYRVLLGYRRRKR